MEIIDRVRGLIPSTALTRIEFLEISAQRHDGQPPSPDQQFPVTIEFGYQLNGDYLAYRFRVSVDRPDLSCAVAVGTMHRVADPEAWNDEQTIVYFGENVALPAAYPYARAKLSAITSDMGVAPVLLGLLVPNAAQPKTESVAQPV